MSDAPIYLDYAATAPVDPRVVARMQQVLVAALGNPSASHAAGRAAHELIEAARAEVAALIGAQSRDITFTSGATEANNLAIEGTLRAAQLQRPRETPHVVTLTTEHKSVLEPVRALGRRGVHTTLLHPAADGLLSVEALAAAITPATRLVTLLHVNNETGVAQDIPALAAVCAAHGVPLHVDACQSAGRLPLGVAGIDLLSFTAHKLGGPQGIGALYVAPRHRGYIEPAMVGGGQERGLRAGTLATHQIAAFGYACSLAAASRAAEGERVTRLRERLWEGLSGLPGVLLNGHPTQRAPGILNVTFAGVEGESLFRALPQLILSTGSACNSRSAEPSYVLRALGRDTQQAQSSLRFSLGTGTTEAAIDTAIAAVCRAHGLLWEASPARPPPVFREFPCALRYQGEAGSLRLGTWVRFVLQVENGFVKQARAQVFGCPETAAVCSHLLQRLQGRPVDDLAAGTPEEWRAAIDVPVEKMGRMLIIEDALGAIAPA